MSKSIVQAEDLSQEYRSGVQESQDVTFSESLPVLQPSKMTDLPFTIYTPESPLRHPGRLLREMFRDLVASRELAWRLFIRDISALYRQSILGYIWAFLPAIATTLAFTYLNSQNVLRVGDTSIPYPAFVMVGTLLWQTFVDALNSPLKVVQSAKDMLVKINFPREALILGGIAEVLFNALIRITLLIPVFLYYRVPFSGTMAWASIGILALILLGLAFGMLITPLGMLYGDVGRGVIMISGFWMLLTPVVYPIPKVGTAALLAQWNPVSPVLQTSREWLTGQSLTHIDGFFTVSFAALAALFLTWILFRLSMPIIIERMGG